MAHSWEDTAGSQAGLCEGPTTGTSRTSRQAGKAAEGQSAQEAEVDPGSEPKLFHSQIRALNEPENPSGRLQGPS